LLSRAGIANADSIAICGPKRDTNTDSDPNPASYPDSDAAS
jgi:hypothetical protein